LKIAKHANKNMETNNAKGLAKITAKAHKEKRNKKQIAKHGGKNQNQKEK